MKILILILFFCSICKSESEEPAIPSPPAIFPLNLANAKDLAGGDIEKFLAKNQSILNRWFVKDQQGKFEISDETAEVTKKEICKLAGVNLGSIKLSHTESGKGIILSRFISFSIYGGSSGFKSALIDLVNFRIFYFDRESFFDNAEYFIEKSRMSTKAVGKTEGNFVLLYGTNLIYQALINTSDPSNLKIFAISRPTVSDLWYLFENTKKAPSYKYQGIDIIDLNSKISYTMTLL